MRISVGLMQARKTVDVELTGAFADDTGALVQPGKHRFTAAVTLVPMEPAATFAVDDVTIGIGFHWERHERQSFRGGLRIIERDGLTVINDVELEDYITSVISSEMSASSSLELLKAHAVISRSWLWYPKAVPESRGSGSTDIRKTNEIVRWYGREAHQDFDVCADDHCQRYQGVTKAFSASVERAVQDTIGEMLTHANVVCDARFYKCCGGFTEKYSAAWDEREVPYLVSLYDGPGPAPFPSGEAWILGDPPAYCNTTDVNLLKQILPNFDQETRDFYRWHVQYDRDELGEIVRSRLDVDLGRIISLEPLVRGASGRIIRLRITGDRGSIVIGKELEIRRALSRSHLYSSAFVVERRGDAFVLKGAGWGHGVGLCQIGAAVMASQGVGYREILRHYYPDTETKRLEG